MVKKYDKDFFEKWVKVSDTSDSGLVWTQPRMFKGVPNYNRVDKSAGHIVKNHGVDSYWNIRLEGNDYLVHKVILTMLDFQIPQGCQIDHIDQNGLNNKLNNMRIVSASTNSRNRPKRKRAIAELPTGVSYHKNKHGKVTGCVAYWADSRNEQVTSYFSIYRYGSLIESVNAADCYRKHKIKELNDAGAGYTELHGV